MRINNRTKFLLSLSLILNFILLGFFTANFLYKNNYQQKWRSVDVSIIEKSEIPAEKKQLIIKTLNELYDYKLNKFKELKRLRFSMKEIINAQEFDAKAYQKQLDKINLLHNDMVNAIYIKIIQLAVKLNVQERQLLAQALKANK